MVISKLLNGPTFANCEVGKTSTVCLNGYVKRASLITSIQCAFLRALRLQQQLSGCSSPFKVFLRPRGVFQWIDIMNLDVQFSLLNKSQQLLGIRFEFLSCSKVSEECRSEQLNVLRRKTATPIRQALNHLTEYLEGELTQS